MTTFARPLVYIVLGTPGSGRRDVLADLIADGLSAEERSLIFLSEAEKPSPADARLGEVRRWKWVDDSIEAEVPSVLEDSSEASAADVRYSHVFFVTDGSLNPVDQMEALTRWIAPLETEFARVVTVVDCTLASQHRELLPWFDACIHFSDVVLLSRREGVENKWMSDFQNRYRDKFIPALFELVKQGKVKNPPLILEPQARRMTHIFDEDTDWTVARSLAPEAEIDFADEDDELEGEESPEGNDGGDSDKEPYFERRQNGHRVIELPDMRNYLGGSK